MLYLDVRTKEEFVTGHYPDAINIPVEQIIQSVFPDVSKDSEITVYCRSGARASVAQQLLRNAGFQNVTNGGGLYDLLQKK
jgi:rhodanese-related sulfurtransferase